MILLTNLSPINLIKKSKMNKYIHKEIKSQVFLTLKTTKDIGKINLVIYFS